MSIIQTSVGGFVLAGYTPAGNSPAWDWTVKINSQGTIIWSKTYGTRPAQSFATNIVEA
jgi:hypothetical protein